MARRHCVAVAIAALLSALLAACDSNGDRNEPPALPETPTFPDGPEGEPYVPDPIEPTAFIEKPCTSLTQEQQKEFHLGGGKPESVAGVSESCTYDYTNVDRWIRIAYSTDEVGLLQPDAVNLEPGQRYEPEVLDNYPAIVSYGVPGNGDPSSPPYCTYMVGLNNKTVLGVVAQDDDGSRCSLARQIAADVLSNIKKHR